MNTQLPFYIHNAVTQPRQLPYTPQRLPDDTAARLNESAREVMRLAANTEIRFRLPPTAEASVTLQAEKENATAAVFFGDYQSRQVVTIAPGQPVTIPVKRTERMVRAMQQRELPPHHRFAPEMVRICLLGHLVQILEVKGNDMALPETDDAPARRLLCCGSSITHGCFASAPQMTYPAQLGFRLGMDVLNLGLRGGFQAEPELADYLAARRDWQVATIELSANMAGKPDQYFFERAKYFTQRLAASDPARQVFAISLFPSWRDLSEARDNTIFHQARAKRNLLEQAVRENRLPNLHFSPGPSLLPTFQGLAEDLLHIGDHGFVQIAENLASIIRLTEKPRP